MKRNDLIATSILLAAGCVANDGESPVTKPALTAEGPTLTVQLAGSTWEIASIGGATVVQDAGMKAPTLHFIDETRASFTGGCNTFRGGYVYGWPETISFDANFASTRMACSPQLMKQDQDLSNALAAAARIVNTDSGKSILDASGRELASLRPLHQP